MPDGSISRSVVIAAIGEDELRQMADAVEQEDAMAEFCIALRMAGMTPDEFVSLLGDDPGPRNCCHCSYGITLSRAS